jgi:hypothetical protein
MKVFIYMMVFSVILGFTPSDGHALFGGITCPPQYRDLSPAPVDSNLYKGHCGLVICTDEGRRGLGTCEPIQVQAYQTRVRMNCRPVPPTAQCFR